MKQLVHQDAPQVGQAAAQFLLEHDAPLVQETGGMHRPSASIPKAEPSSGDSEMRPKPHHDNSSFEFRQALQRPNQDGPLGAYFTDSKKSGLSTLTSTALALLSIHSRIFAFFKSPKIASLTCSNGWLSKATSFST